MEMEDRVKLVQVAAFLKDRLDPTDGRLRWVKDDGGRRASGIARAPGRKDAVGDCVTRAIAIAAEMPYREVHNALTLATVQHLYAGSDNDYWGKWDRRRGGVRAFDPDHGCRDSHGEELDAAAFISSGAVFRVGELVFPVGCKRVGHREFEMPQRSAEP
jgi:hypothetical protein